MMTPNSDPMLQDRLLRTLLSRLDPRAVPIITRLANLSARPSLETCVKLSAVLVVINIAICAALFYAITLQSTALFVTGALIRGIGLILMFGAALLLLMMPVVTAVFAARLAARDVHSENFTLLRLTNITGKALFQGYCLAALYRLRLVLALAFGAIPLYASLVSYFSLGVIVNVQNGSFFLMGWDLAVRLAYYGLIGVGLWGMSFFGAVMGVNVGLRSCAPDWAAAAPFGVGIIMLGTALALNGFVSPLFNGPIARLYQGVVPLIILIGLVIAVAPFLGTISAFRRSNRPLPETRL